MNKLVLVDGNSIAYRAFFALPLLNNDKGIYTNAIYGFTTMLLKVIEEEKPTHMLVAFDAGKTTFRHDTYKEYKGTRQKTPSELSEQLPLMRDLLKAFNIPSYELENYEADDIIGTLAKKAEEDDWNVKIYTGDKDLLQLVSDRVHVALTRKGITEVDTYTVAAVNEKYGISPMQIIDMKGLMGDSSDNIPGVPGVGEKTSLKLLKQFESVEGVYDTFDDVTGKKLRENLENNKEQAFMSKELATIKVDSPITVTYKDAELTGTNDDKVIEIFKELGFASLLDRFSGSGDEEEELEDIDVTIVKEVDKSIFEESPSAVVVEVLEDNYHHANILGIGIANKKGQFFIPTHVAKESTVFQEWAKDEKNKKWIFDAKRAVVALGWEGIQLNGITFDVQIASYLIDPSASSHEIGDIAKRKKNLSVQTDDVFYGKGKKRQIPEEDKFAQHIARKAAAIKTLKEDLEEELKSNEQYELFEQLEMPLSIILGKMEMEGIAINPEHLRGMGKELDEKLTQMEKEIYELAGTKFNVNSPKQLGEILFEKLGLPVIKKTKTGYSTAADVLDQLVDKHEIIKIILQYRTLKKLSSTYVEGLLKVIHEKTGKIHTIYNQALTQTGRLSSTEPNLQNIPIRMEEGRKIRQAFIPEKENSFIFAADYSQIELRVLADISQDDNLVSAFNNDMDIHTKTAMDVFHVEQEVVTSDMRRTAKAVNFGIIYGMSDYGLSQNLDITRKEAKTFIEKYFDIFPGVKDYMDNIVKEAREKGYVTTMLHRRRYLPEITSSNFNQRSFAERTAMNTPIQGSAADIIKKAMVEIVVEMDKEKLQSKLLLQVHDELIFEVPEEELEIMKELVPRVMEAAIKLSVPLKVDYSYGKTWYEAD